MVTFCVRTRVALSCPNEEGGPIERGIDDNRRVRI
jgi:hypothetical protein